MATVRFTANFERNLQAVEQFLLGANAAHAFDGLLAELSDTVVPNLERFSKMGRPFFERPIRSVESHNATEKLRAQLETIHPQAEVREYMMQHYMVLYALVEASVYLLCIRHHRQLSFDFARHWTD